jgi:hypothetical protein
VIHGRRPVPEHLRKDIGDKTEQLSTRCWSEANDNLVHVRCHFELSQAGGSFL